MHNALCGCCPLHRLVTGVLLRNGATPPARAQKVHLLSNAGYNNGLRVTLLHQTVMGHFRFKCNGDRRWLDVFVIVLEYD